jgi:hypothetical protein
MSDDITADILRVIRDDLAAMKANMATMQVSITGLTRSVSLLHQDVRMIRAAVNDIAREHVSTGEVEALHTDVNSLLDRMAQLEARMDAIEQR